MSATESLVRLPQAGPTELVQAYKNTEINTISVACSKYWLYDSWNLTLPAMTNEKPAGNCWLWPMGSLRRDPNWRMSRTTQGKAGQLCLYGLNKLSKWGATLSVVTIYFPTGGFLRHSRPQVCLRKISWEPLDTSLGKLSILGNLPRAKFSTQHCDFIHTLIHTQHICLGLGKFREGSKN